MSKRILIVDDQAENLQVIADILKYDDNSYEIMKAPNGRIALKLISRKIPDLIISDWEMPVMDGIEFIKKLRKDKKTIDIPVIICTGVMLTSENLQTALQAGASDYIRKPVDNIELVARTNSMLQLAASKQIVKMQNSELEQQKEEIMSINDSLFEKQEIITNQKLSLENNLQKQQILNKQLSDKNIELDKFVKKLKQSEIIITKKNTELLKLSHVVSNTDNGVMIIDKTGKIEWVNKGFTKLYGFTLEEFTSKSDNIFKCSTNTYINNFIKDAIDNKKSVVYKVELTHKNNSKLWIQTTWSPVIDKNGDLINLVAIDADITEIKRAECKIRNQNKNITDSINYAKKIQTAVLPSPEIVKKILLEHFIFFKPRNIVSGDFYWIKKVKQFVMLAAVDCTGHGVPGAFMSMLGVSFMNEISEKHEFSKASIFLEELRNKVKLTLKQTGKQNETTDGMDIAFCIINTETNTAQYAGAYNPLIIIRNNKLVEYKATRNPIGFYLKEKKFNNNKISLKKEDLIYHFSDGFNDQIGGEYNRKFMFMNFKNLLLEIHKLPMVEQKQKLARVFDNWKAKEKQTDDVIVLGIKIQ